MRPVAEEPRSEHHVGLAIEQRLEQGAVLSRIVFEVRVLHDDEVGGRLLKTPPQGCSLALVVRLPQQPQAGVDDRLRDADRIVSRPVVDHDHLSYIG